MNQLEKWRSDFRNFPKGIRLFLTFLIASAGGAVFSWMHTPLPWLLGPLLAMVACILLGFDKLWIPGYFRKAGLIVVGIVLGLRITPEIWQMMTQHIGEMLVATIFTLLFGMLNAWIVHRVYRVDLTTSIFSNIPGGLSEMVTLGQSQGGNLQIISMFHSIRIVVIVMLTPFLVTFLSHKAALPAVSGGNQVLGWWTTVGLLAVSAIGAFLATKLRVPAAFLLGPLFVAALFSVSPAFSDGMHGMASWLVNAAQIAIGISIGVEFKRDEVLQYRKLFVAGFFHALLLSGLSITLGIALAYSSGIHLFTSMLATAPGGIAEMSLTALAIGSDPLMVTAFQLFRVLFIVTVFTACIRWYLRRVNRRKTDNGDTAA
ncbi:AbrB family transcriptional regulator [Brevibacillus migulae]|uniref:AbrB family transcriptional regulator n=1 Tax=Brevibacillus migulae TaxID=1644114 RepID=UPI00106E5DA7|nr:AbrB family transcriptional regulator [Brevibacillus migulae]